MDENVLKFDEAVDKTTGEIVPVDSIAAVDRMTAQEYQQWLATENIDVAEFDGGSDWDLVGNKDTLVDRDIVIARVRFNNTDSGDFVSVCAYTVPEGDKVVFNDGGTGIYRQLMTYVNKTGRTTAIRCRKGLRVSRYKFTDDSGKERDAATYYLA